MNLPAKDPAESIVIEFDFSAELRQIATAALSIAVVSGTDINAAAMLDGPAQISGGKVFQRVRAGVDRASYKIACTATNAADVRKLVAILPVRAL